MTTKYQTVGNMPRSSATYAEYQTFLARIHVTYEKQFGLLKHTQQVEYVTKLSEKLIELAKSSHVNIPAVVIKSNTEIIRPFNSTGEVVKAIEKFYSYFKSVHWNDQDLRNVEQVSSIVILPVMHF